MDNGINSSPTDPPRDDRVLSITRLLAAAVIPFLVAAFLILYLSPEDTTDLFAWSIASPLTTSLMGAGYLGGAYFFARVLTGDQWHRVGGGFPAVAVFTAVMLAATLLHWDTFDPGHWPFLVWLAIYIVTPAIVPAVWWINRRRDPVIPEAAVGLLPPQAGWFLLLAGLGLAGSAAFLFLWPAAAIDLWPWPLTPLTARVLAGWLALLAAGALAMARERRWSGWRIPVQSILLWQILLLAAFYLRRDAFGPAGPVNWYTGFTLLGVVASATFYLLMERRRRSVEP